MGPALVMFAGELASAVQPDEFRGELPAGLVAACKQAVTAAMLAAAACLAGLAEMAQLPAALAGQAQCHPGRDPLQPGQVRVLLPQRPELPVPDAHEAHPAAGARSECAKAPQPLKCESRAMRHPRGIAAGDGG